MTERRIMVVEDEPEIRALLRDNLEYEGYEILEAPDGEVALDALSREQPDLIILDVMLPGIDGFDVLREIRARRLDVPVILLTARGRESDKVVGLELGADDYVTKPFGVRELVARIKANLRRLGPGAQSGEVYRLSNVVIDCRRRILAKGDIETRLTTFETEVLRLLCQHLNRPVSRRDFLDKVWGESAYPTNRTIDNFIARLRKKIEDDPSEPTHILTVHGVGYKMVE